ncbi:LysR family transcriptional regulator [Ferrimonas senticii]|uniref:LysR family transcriptional regulator n=1 Tax=Ferrimonas senticii TaxID=394566 RepID=UPI000428AD5F|nr:LysR family transcriptional regulator [Ferrimonas senticii]
MNWTLDQLEAFVCAARTGSFSAAARQLGKAQSRVSTAVANLEADFGVELFDRSKRSPRLTVVGEQLLNDAEVVLLHCRQLNNKALQAAQGEPLALRLAVDEAVSLDGFHSVINQIGVQFPQLRLTLTSGSRDDVGRAIAAGQAELGVMFRQPQLPANVDFELIGHIERVLIVGCDHPLAGRERVSLVELRQDKQLLICDRDGVGGDQPFGSNYWFMDSYYVIGDLVSRNQGWAIMPEHIVNGGWFIDEVKVLRCDELHEQLQMGIVRRHDSVSSVTVDWLTDQLKQQLGVKR